jgi:uncharacterized protein (UPF0335 family)
VSDCYASWIIYKSDNGKFPSLCGFDFEPGFASIGAARPSHSNLAACSNISGVALLEGIERTAIRSREQRLINFRFRLSAIRQPRGFALTRWSLLCVHFHDLIQQRGTMSDISIPGGRIRSFVERIEHIDTELQELNESKKEVFSEAKAEGFDVKILKEIIKLRKQDKGERDERDTLLDMYMRAMETAGPEQAAKAA